MDLLLEYAGFVEKNAVEFAVIVFGIATLWALMIWQIKKAKRILEEERKNFIDSL